MSKDVTTTAIGGRRVRRDDARAADAYARGWWTRGTLADSLAEAVQRTPQRVVVIDGESRVDCRSLYERAAVLARAMRARMPTGSVVSFMLPNWHEAAAIYLAATVAGMVVNPILPSLRDHELRFILQDSDCRMIFVPSEFGRHDYASMLDRVTAHMGSPPEVVVVRGSAETAHTPFASLLAGQPSVTEPPTLDPDAVRMILYTSGTAGGPKGVLHSHNSIHALIRQIRDYWQVHPGDKFLVPSPIAHIGG
ncbi:MAG: AMP-binding protein, partial [Mycobacterium sp.]|nr:AMP-binding protein [Mycobacterium sp.]